jgi:hypothetical protein
MTPTFVVHAVVIGLVGGLAFDIWNWLAQRFLGVRAPNWAILGRWLMAPFTPSPALVAPGPPVFTPVERGLGTIAHYLTAVVFAAGLLLAAGQGWMDHPTLLPAIAVGLVTTLLPWLIIMPALGHGIAASKTPIANKIRIATVASHLVMGLGFYAGAAAAAATLSGVVQ